MENSLTSGHIGKALIKFSTPMILANLLQQLYNIADTIIVGKTLGPVALVAVGSSYALMVLLTSIILGLCMGSGVVFAHFFGAKQLGQLRVSIFNAAAFIALCSVVINIGAFLLLTRFIGWMNIPQEAVLFTTEYLRVIFVGFVFVSIYNFLAAILRSIGNTVVPLVFLAVAAVTNIILDIVFIVFFEMGVAGAAWATVIAQFLSALLITFYFFKKATDLCPQKEHLRFDKRIFSMIVNHSVLTAIQQSIMNFGILMVQSLVNSFGTAVSAAFAVVVKIDAFAYMPAQDFGNAFATFVAQNNGAKQPKRIYRGCMVAVKVSACFCVMASLIVCVFAKQLMLIFLKSSDLEIINIGIRYLRIEGACYIGIGILFLLYGFYRGIGKAGMSITLTVVSLGSRVVLAYLLSAIPAVGVLGIWWAVPIGWLLADMLGIWGFCRLNRQMKLSQ